MRRDGMDLHQCDPEAFLAALDGCPKGTAPQVKKSWVLQDSVSGTSEGSSEKYIFKLVSTCCFGGVNS